MKKILLILGYCMANTITNGQTMYHEPYRPQIHFSPKEHWVNDPNGMVYYKGVYHLFFQYYPGASVWGPMHWGHATSKDLVHWEQQPIALYPDTLGYIFSGSAVVDEKNTSGFGKNGQPPLVAIYTNHNADGEKAKRNDFQTQSIAYSLDEGKSWTKYAMNPVIKNPGVTDFRDPKVSWFAAQKKWVMTLATKDRITFYSSPNLKDWKKESEFGEKLGSHGGVWECPDLFQLNDNGKKVWVLIVNIGSGAPNGGSGTQYFVGDFDGTTFTPNSTKTKWLDYGPDDYAGITWSNTGDRKIFIGWMSNWQYANLVPTTKWRNAMTIPRELNIRHVEDEILVASEPVKELNGIQSKSIIKENITINKNDVIDQNKFGNIYPCKLKVSINQLKDFAIILSNDVAEKIIIGFDKGKNEFYIDRTNAGNTNFEKGFGVKHIVPRFTKSNKTNLTLIVDESSIELFADGGLSNLTSLYFSTKRFTHVAITAPSSIFIDKMEYLKLNSIWK